MRIELGQVVPLTDVFSDSVLSEIGKLQRVLEWRFAADEVLYDSGDRVTHLWFLRKGIVAISTTSEQGKRFTLRFLEGPTVLGEDIFTPEDQGSLAHHSHTATALMPCETTLIHRGHMCELVRKYPEVIVEIFSVLTRRWVAMYRKTAWLASLPAGPRAMALLPEISFWFGVAQHRLTNDRIAAHAGCTRETISKAISSLRKAGVVGVDECENITVLDSGKLQEWVQKRQKEGIVAIMHKALPPMALV